MAHEEAVAQRTAAQRAADLAYALAALVATVMGLVDGPRTALVVTCLLVALLPWALVVAHRDLPPLLHVLVTMGPVIPVVLVTGIGGALFLTTVTASWVASRSDDHRLIAATTAAALLMPFLAVLSSDGWDLGAAYFSFGDGFGVLVGVLLRRATALAEQLHVAQGRLAEAAAAEERRRIARDVHDLIAHSLTVVVLHVGGARRVLHTDPGAAEAALTDAERVCRQSLDGIRGVVGLLRDGEGALQPASLELGDLVGSYRAAGLPVTLQLAGDLTTLPLTVRVTLHRVVREALANAARHAGTATPTAVEVAVDTAVVTASVTNHLPAATASTSSPGHGGHGLVGLREQVAAAGGDLVDGPDGDTWVVRCRLPLDAPDLTPAHATAAGRAVTAADRS